MLTLNPIFSDGAVFAANRPIRVFGSGTGHVSIEFLGARRQMNATSKNWCVQFDPLPYGGPYEMTVTLDGVKTVLSDLWIGEVLLLSGQSNISFRMNESKDYPALSEPCPSLRVFHAERVDKLGKFRPMHGWKRCDTDEVIANTSAIGYETGILLAKQLGVPVGLLSAAQGASVIQSWIPKGTLEAIGISFAPDRLHRDHSAHPLWNGDGTLYRTMLKPNAPYSLSRVIWYQGESNASIDESAVYDRMLTELIRIWRNDFDDAALPFVIVQLADTEKRMKESIGWETIQKKQWEIGHVVPNVTTVICADVCETDDIHPPTKRYLSERIASAIINTEK